MLLLNTAFLVSKNIENDSSVHILLFFKQHFVCYDIQFNISFMWCKQKKNSIKEVICVLHSSFWMVTYTLADKCYQTCVDIPNTKADNSLYISLKLLSSLECKLWEMGTKCLPFTYIFFFFNVHLTRTTQGFGACWLSINSLGNLHIIWHWLSLCRIPHPQIQPTWN